MAGTVGGQCSPHYVSIKQDRVNSHKGPGVQYKRAFAYIVSGTPVMVTAKYDNWRRIKDPEGCVSWVHKSQLSSRRSVIVTYDDGAKLLDSCSTRASVIAHVKKNVVMMLLSTRGNLCKVEVRNKSDGKKYVGWIENDKVFGVDGNELL
jgi:SH3-like domain-containing protein